MTTIANWEAFAEATLTGQDSARNMGRQLAAATPPIALASKARHRKPQIRRRWFRLPLWAGAILQLFDALREQTAATEAQLAALTVISQGRML